MDEIQVFFIDDPRAVTHVVDDPVFSHVSNSGETYELFEITAITREYLNHPLGWTHGITAKQCNSGKSFSADIRVVNFCVDDSEVHDFS